jgi:anti-anti-sigma factor
MNEHVNSGEGQPLTLRWRREQGWLRIALNGELDTDGVAHLVDCIDTACAVSPRLDAVQVDLVQLSFVDLRGLRGLAAACRKLEQVADSLQVSGASEQLRRLVQISHLTIPGLIEPVPARPRSQNMLSVAAQTNTMHWFGDPVQNEHGGSPPCSPLLLRPSASANWPGPWDAPPSSTPSA